MKCPECNDGIMVLRQSEFGKFYGCSNFPNCTARHGAHQDTGEPLGVPGNERTRHARIRAHAIFDRLWKGDESFMNRPAAYEWLQKHGPRSHIGEMSESECQLLIKKLIESFPECKL